MKVKNIMFSGFMAAIMMSATAGVANAAVSVASRGYVDQQVGTKVSTSDFNTFKTDNTAAIKKAADDAQAAAEATAAGALDAYKTEANNTYAAKTYVGTFTSDTAQTIVDYINEKTTGIATDAALSELQGKVSANEGAIADLETADTALGGRLDVLEGEGEGSVAKSITDAIAGLSLDTTYEKAGVAAGLVNTLKTTEVAANASAIEALQGADTAIDGRLDVIEGEGEGSVKKALADAKAYADGLADNYDAEGTAAALVKVLEEGKVAENTSAINTLKSDVETNYAKTAAVTAAIATAKGEAITDAEGKIAVAKKAVEDSLNALATAEVPEECTADGTTICVLTLGKNGTYNWVALTEPVNDDMTNGSL